MCAEHKFSNHQLIIFDSDCRHYGLGFVISPRVQPYVTSYQRISDRVATLDVRLPTRNVGFKLFRFVNAYGPTNKLPVIVMLKTLKDF